MHHSRRSWGGHRIFHSTFSRLWKSPNVPKDHGQSSTREDSTTDLRSVRDIELEPQGNEGRYKQKDLTASQSQLFSLYLCLD